LRIKRSVDAHRRSDVRERSQGLYDPNESAAEGYCVAIGITIGLLYGGAQGALPAQRRADAVPGRIRAVGVRVNYKFGPIYNGGSCDIRLLREVRFSSGPF
jgi:hypothetical protein